MIKTVLILSSLLTGMASFASQSTQTSRKTNTLRQLLTECAGSILVGNIRLQTTTAGCESTNRLLRAQTQLINWGMPTLNDDPYSGTFQESNLSSSYLLP